MIIVLPSFPDLDLVTALPWIGLFLLVGAAIVVPSLAALRKNPGA